MRNMAIDAGWCKIRHDTCIRYVNGFQSVIEICDMNAFGATQNLIKHSHSHTINHIILSIRMSIAIHSDGWATLFFYRTHVGCVCVCVSCRLFPWPDGISLIEAVNLNITHEHKFITQCYDICRSTDHKEIGIAYCLNMRSR